MSARKHLAELAGVLQEIRAEEPLYIQLWILMMLGLIGLCALTVVGVFWYGGIWVAQISSADWMTPWTVRGILFAGVTLITGGVWLDHYVRYQARTAK